MDFSLIFRSINYFNFVDFLYISAGVLFGIIVAAIPGLSGSIGMALLLPFTYVLSPIRSLATLGGLYAGAMYGGSISAILLNIPGTGAAVATAIDGYPLAQKGKAAEALYASVFASFVGGIIGTFALLLLVQPLAKFSLKFGPVEFFWLAVLGISTIAYLTSKNLIKGIIMGLFGLLLSTIGLDPLSGNDRFSFGIPELTGGIPIIPIIIAMFAIPQIFKYLEANKISIGNYTYKRGTGVKIVKSLFCHMKLLMFKSSVIGTIIGIIPGAGGYVASLISYTEAKNSSKNPEQFGEGKLEGVVAAEAGNSATTGGALIPMLTFGIPGSNITAIMIGALLMQGFDPGPDLFAQHGEIVFAFILSLFFSFAVMLIFGIFGAKLFSKVLNIRGNIIISTLLVICVIGAYSIRANMTDVILMLFLGIVGYFLSKLDFPLPPVVLGLILGTIAERGLRQALVIGSVKNSLLGYLFLRPISMALIALTLLIIIFPFYQDYKRKKLKKNKNNKEKNKIKLSFITKKKKCILSDIIISVVIIIISITLILNLKQYPVESGIFPKAILLAFIILSIILIITNLLRKEWASIQEGRWAKFPTVPWSKLNSILLLYILFILIFPHIGFFISSFIFMFITLFLIDSKAYTKNQLTQVILKYFTFCLIANFIIYFLFIKILNLPLPVYFIQLISSLIL